MSEEFPAMRPPPRHVGIIMDGNGRWAKERGLPRNVGHKAGVDNVRKIVETAKELDLSYLTLYAFSVENWKRPKAEVEALMWLLRQYLESEADTLVEKEIRFQVLGALDPFPRALQNLIHKVVERTSCFDRWTLNLAINYGSRSEVLHAVKEILGSANEDQIDPESLTWETFRRFLQTGEMPDPDLIIRTSGEHRISNFLLLQSAYAEFYFAEDYWPDFTPDRFREAINDYQNRERRFGLTQEQLVNQAK